MSDQGTFSAPGARPGSEPMHADADPGALTSGAMVGEYRITALIGRGGMGRVYAASQPVIGKVVAIKVLDARGQSDQRLVERFIDEARAVNKIRHPNIVDIFSFGRLPDGRHYFVMELLEGQTLEARLQEAPLPLAEGRRLLAQICDALHAAHEGGIVHRDLKPDNIWIARPRHGDVFAKILDFGIAKLADRSATPITEAGFVLGTAHFMSPEQCLGQPVDRRTDIYAVGVILYRMFAGALPFRGNGFAELIAQHVTATPPPPSVLQPIAPALEAVILACLAKDPAARPPTARALADALAQALGEAAAARVDATQASFAEPPAWAVSPPPHEPKGAKRKVAVGIAAVALIAGGATLAWRGLASTSPGPPPVPVVITANGTKDDGTKADSTQRDDNPVQVRLAEADPVVPDAAPTIATQVATSSGDRARNRRVRKNLQQPDVRAVPSVEDETPLVRENPFR